MRRRVAVFAGAAFAVALLAFAVAPMFTSEPAKPQPETPDTPEPAPKPVERQDAKLGRPIVREGDKMPVRTQPAKPPPRQVEPPKPPPEEESSEIEPGAALVGLDFDEASMSELRELKVPEGQTGVVIRSVDPGSPAAEAALQKNDVIVRAQRDKISTKESLRAAIGTREHTLLTVYRDGYPFQVVIHTPFKGDSAPK